MRGRSVASHYADAVASPDKPSNKISGARRAALQGGRFTPKGTAPKTKGKGPAKPGDAKSAAEDAPDTKTPAYANSGRYTAPAHHEKQAAMQETKPWVVPAIVFFLLLGLLLIVNYYVGVLPGGRSGYYLLGGLAAITAGFAVATQLK